MNSKLNPNRLAMWIIPMAATLAALNGCASVKPVLESVVVRDTVIVTKTKYLTDTLELYKDTTIYQDKVRLQLQYIDRKVFVEATCLPDTIRVTQTKILTKERKHSSKRRPVGCVTSPDRGVKVYVLMGFSGGDTLRLLYKMKS